MMTAHADAQLSVQRSALRTLNAPEVVAVETGMDGAPRAVRRGGRRIAVEVVIDSWRIDDEWWREEISRRYYQLALADGRTLTVFTDLIAGGWYAQRYAAEMVRALVLSRR